MDQMQCVHIEKKLILRPSPSGHTATVLRAEHSRSVSTAPRGISHDACTPCPQPSNRGREVYISSGCAVSADTNTSSIGTRTPSYVTLEETSTLETSYGLCTNDECNSALDQSGGARAGGIVRTAPTVCPVPPPPLFISSCISSRKRRCAAPHGRRFAPLPAPCQG